MILSNCFNPCFNGYSILTNWKTIERYYFKESFNPCFNGYSILTGSLILSVVTSVSFNPCFNGYSILTKKENKLSVDSLLVSILVLMDTLF